MSEDHKLQDLDFPGLYQAADADSRDAQCSYFRTLGWFLCLLIVGATANLFASASPLLSIISAVFLLGSLLLSGLLAWRRYERTWYSARAVAESVKTRTWRYMMRCEPYQADKTADELFLSDLQEILSDNRDVTKELCDESASKDAISVRMKEIRSISFDMRLSFYLENRVADQGKWYQAKALINKEGGSRWFSVIMGLNAFAVLCALVRIRFTNWIYLPTEVLTVAAASAVSWLQAKRFSELSTSYALTAHEINIIRARGPSVHSESDLSQYVSDTENAFSREHTQWAARRDAISRTTVSTVP